MTIISSEIGSQSRTQFRQGRESVLDMSHIGCVILAGGEGKRLYPLTRTRCKPAIHFGGHYRLIDVPLSHAIHLGCGKVFVMTQFLSASLETHLLQTYQNHMVGSKRMKVLGAEKYNEPSRLFAGTADAVRQCLEDLLATSAEYFLILSGDQLYNMDFSRMVACALSTDADVVVASLPLEAATATRMGVLKVDDHCRICDFVEKPKDPQRLKGFHCPKSLLKPLGKDDDPPLYLASMGIYLFKREALQRILIEDTREDFGQHIIPTLVSQGKASAYLYEGYWEDIGTVSSFYQANMALTRPEPFFNCYDESTPLYHHMTHLPPPKISRVEINHSILCNGCVVEGKEISHGILGPQTVVKSGTIIRDTYAMGQHTIGRQCHIERAILDNGVTIGDDVRLCNANGMKEYDSDLLHVRDGIIVIAANTHIPNGFCF